MARGKRRGKRKQDAKWMERSSELDMSNDRFENFYRAQNILPDDEWDAFMLALRRPLPSTFRIAANRQMKDVLSDAIKNNFIPKLETGSYNGEPLPVPRPIPWYPDGLAWQVTLGRKELKKAQEYKKFHEFLVYETEVGNISRQEAVSMIPPLFLDVRPHHSAIDLCAAPGSKTSQLIEAMDPPTGILIANDSDHKRSHLLVHQTSRLPSPGFMVTNLDASIFPALRYKDKPLRFDRILADVPCSGDGTLRKNLGIWKTWNALEGNGLHSLQLRILQRAMRMLRHDGPPDDRPRIVYSTCSLNPVENEAVIAAALNSIPGFELVDVSDTLPALIRRPGISSWRPAVDREVDMSYASYKDYCDSLDSSKTPALPANGEVIKKETVEGEGQGYVKERTKTANRPVRNRMLETHWPPANAKDLNLERCMRIYPHLQDSGGFFIAVMQRRTADTLPAPQKKAEGKRASETVETRTGSQPPSSVGEPASKKARFANEQSLDGTDPTQTVDATAEAEPTAESGGAFKEDPYTFVPPDDPSLISCIERLGLSESFPSSNIFVRNPEGTPVRSLYLVNDAVKSVMMQTDYTRIRLVSAGVKLFGRSEIGNIKALREAEGSGKVLFRVLSEGLLALLPYVDQKKLLVGGANELRTLLEAYHPLCSSFEEPFKTSVQSSSLGSHIIRFSPGNYGNASISHDLFLPLWKSDLSVSLMIDKKSKSALSLRFFGEDITVVGRQAAKQQEKKSEEQSVVEGDDTMDDNDATNEPEPESPSLIEPGSR